MIFIDLKKEQVQTEVKDDEKNEVPEKDDEQSHFSPIPRILERTDNDTPVTPRRGRRVSTISASGSNTDSHRKKEKKTFPSLRGVVDSFLSHTPKDDMALVSKKKPVSQLQISHI